VLIYITDGNTTFQVKPMDVFLDGVAEGAVDDEALLEAFDGNVTYTTRFHNMLEAGGFTYRWELFAKQYPEFKDRTYVNLVNGDGMSKQPTIVSSNVPNAWDNAWKGNGYPALHFGFKHFGEVIRTQVEAYQSSLNICNFLNEKVQKGDEQKPRATVYTIGFNIGSAVDSGYVAPTTIEEIYTNDTNDKLDFTNFLLWNCPTSTQHQFVADSSSLVDVFDTIVSQIDALRLTK